MIYGRNFGAPDIPADLRRKVSERRVKGIPLAKGTVAILVGCTDTIQERNMMAIVGNNGRRGLDWQIVKGWHYVWAYCR